jgi:diguanylate cyclase (GGDEF)-like protein
MKRRATLKTRILLTTAVFVVAVVGVVLAMVAWTLRDQTEQAARAASSRAKAVLEQSVSEGLERLSVETSLVASLPNTKSVTGAPDSLTVTDFLEARRSEIAVDWILWTDLDGVAFAQTSNAGFALGTDLSTTRGVREALEERAWRGTLVRDGEVMLVATAPVTIGNYVKATLTAGDVLTADRLKKIAESAQVEIAMFAGSDLVASTLGGDGKLDPSQEGQLFVVEGERYLGGVIQLPSVGGDIRLLALTPESAVTTPYATLTQTLLGLLFVGLGASLLIGLSLARRLIEPLDALGAAARELQEGRWPEPFCPTHRDEVGFLQDHFDKMTASLRSSHERLVAMLEIDPLTELWNHRTFKEKLGQAIAKGGEVAVVLFDIDDFESYNQKHGADKGDDAIVSVANVVRMVAGEDAVCGRYGGNEFAVVCFGPEPDQVGESIRNHIERSTPVTVSVGVCVWSDSTSKPDTMLLGAEMAVSQAKSAGRNRTRVFEGFETTGDDESLRRLLRGGSYAAVRALAEAVDAKDNYTRGHSQRVAEYARDLAEACGYDSGFVEVVFVSGTLHDVGKIGVPDEILKKTSRLTDEEFEQIKLHPELGERIVVQIPELRDALPGVRSHHERFDGCGYPDGLAGTDIPLIARILAVADAFDAMTSDRSYRQGMSFEDAVAQIESGADVQFDPVLAATFVALMRERRAAA